MKNFAIVDYAHLKVEAIISGVVGDLPPGKYLVPIPDDLTGLDSWEIEVALEGDAVRLIHRQQSIEEQRGAALARMRDAVGRRIAAGVVSSVLGAPHTYPTNQTDQLNLAGLVLAGIGGKFWCANGDGIWARRAHTAEQLRAVGEAVRTHVVACQDAWETILNDMVSANTAAEIQQVGGGLI